MILTSKHYYVAFALVLHRWGMCSDFIFVRVVSTVQSNTTSTSLSYKCYVSCRGRRISEIIVFYFISIYCILFHFITEQYTRGFQWMLFEKVCGIHVYYINRPILFSVHTHQSSWGICPTDDEFDCSKEEITAQCMFHPNNIVSFSCCSAMHSKTLTAASSWTTGNVLGSSPHPFSPHLARSCFNLT